MAGTASTEGAGEFTASVGDRVYFGTDQTDIGGQAEVTLTKQASWLARHRGYTFIIEGNADERGTREYNFALGEKRARAVADYLRARGIEGSRMRIISYGKEHPIAVCDAPSCWSQNRRAVTVLDGPQS